MANLDLDDDSMYLKISSVLDALFSRVDETVTEQEEQLQANKKNTELESRFAQELKLNEDVGARLAAAERRRGELARAAGRGGVSVAPGDQQRLNTAREMYQIAKEMTGIRWDFTAPPELAKGYMKSESRRLLEPFALPAAVPAAAPAAELWRRAAALAAAPAAAAPAAAAAAPAGKENLPPP